MGRVRAVPGSIPVCASTQTSSTFRSATPALNSGTIRPLRLYRRTSRFRETNTEEGVVMETVLAYAMDQPTPVAAARYCLNTGTARRCGR